MIGAIFEFQAQSDFDGGHGVGAEFFALVVEDARDQEKQGFEQRYWMVELDAVLVGDFRLKDFERTIGCASGELLQVDAGRSEAFGDAGFRESGELGEGVDAPAFEHLPHFLLHGETRDVELFEIGRDGDARKIVRGENGGVGGFGEGDVGIRTGFFGYGLRDFAMRAVETAQIIDAEDDGAGSSLLEGRREGFGDFRQVGLGGMDAGEHIYPSDLALKCAVRLRTGLRGMASSSTSRISS